MRTLERPTRPRISDFKAYAFGLPQWLVESVGNPPTGESATSQLQLTAKETAFFIKLLNVSHAGITSIVTSASIDSINAYLRNYKLNQYIRSDRVIVSDEEDYLSGYSRVTNGLQEPTECLAFAYSQNHYKAAAAAGAIVVGVEINDFHSDMSSFGLGNKENMRTLPQLILRNTNLPI